ncbi:thiol-disulfide oxidoreductase DCC family protein [Marinicrinis lubricantis]
MPKHLLLYDGECGLCSRTVQFVLKKDRKEMFYFAPLQSQLGRQIAERCGLDAEQLSTFIYIREGLGLTKSAAALHVLKSLGMPWSAGFMFIILPKRFRDACYDVIAKRRHRWFPWNEQCLIIDRHHRHRFLS